MKENDGKTESPSQATSLRDNTVRVPEEVDASTAIDRTHDSATGSRRKPEKGSGDGRLTYSGLITGPGSCSI